MRSLSSWIFRSILALRLLAAPLVETDLPEGMSVLASPSPKPGTDFEAPPGTTPREAITGTRSGSTIGRPENPWDTRGKPRREDGHD